MLRSAARISASDPVSKSRWSGSGGSARVDSTNRSDARMMTEANSQRRLARAIASAILTYLAEFERRSDAGSASGAGRSGS